MERNLRQRTGQGFAGGDISDNLLFTDNFSKKESPSLFSNRTLLSIFLTYFFLFLVVIYCDTFIFPSPEPVLTGKAASIQFSEERAKSFVIKLSKIGPKPTGSHENEIQAVDYIRSQLFSIKHNSKGANIIDIDVQRPSGCFSLAFMDGMTSCYSNIQNVIARIKPQKATNKSLLINCHFDTAIISPGASDNLVNCGVMLEVLTVLSQSNQPLPNEVIFLFNGAEENFHQGAHGFITQHPWAKTVVGFIDMEACGSGGKQMLFQANREKTWLLQAYANSTPYPLGSVTAQDIFQNGIIPSDTDYRIFDQVGNLPGLDFSYIKNGYVYHTKYDVPNAITKGSMQQAGLNLLNLLKNALQSPDMKHVADQKDLPLMFFDFLGLFMVVYPISFARVLNILIIFASFGDFFWKSFKSSVSHSKRLALIGEAFLSMLCSFVASYLICVAIVLVLGVFNASMSWYGSPYLIVGLYGCSSLAVLLTIHSRKASQVQDVHDKWLREDTYFDAARLIWIILLVLMELCNVNSSFICCTWLLFPTVIRGMFGNLYDTFGYKRNKQFHLLMHISMQAIPLVFLIYCFWILFSVLIPIMGRSGTTLNPELLIGSLTNVFVLLSTSYMVSLIHVMTSPRKVITFLMVVLATTICLVCFTSLGFPYSGDWKSPKPMRLYILHTQRTFHDVQGKETSQDSGYWFIPLDTNGPRLVKKIFDMNDIEPVDCDTNFACGMPFYIPVQSLIKITYYLPSPKPKLLDEREFKLISKIPLGKNSVRLSFEAKGPDHMTVIFSPRPGVMVVKWSFSSLPPLRNLDWRGRPTYFIYYSFGQYKEPWTFSMDLTVNDKNMMKGDTFIDMHFITHYLSGQGAVTGSFQSLLQQVPSWVDVVPWTSTLDSYSF